MLEGMTPQTSRGSCKVAAISQSLSDADKTILLQAIEDNATWSIRALARALAERGIVISDTPLTSHRAQTCVCYR
jgi:hypothetical protein